MIVPHDLSMKFIYLRRQASSFFFKLSQLSSFYFVKIHDFNVLTLSVDLFFGRLTDYRSPFALIACSMKVIQYIIQHK